MAENEEKFSDAFKSDGGILDYQSMNMGGFIDPIVQMLKHCLEQLQRQNDRFPMPYLYIINNSILNAKVTKINEKYIIGFNGGTLLLIDDLFHRMLSSAEVLTEYGDASNESIEKIYNAKITNFHIWRNVTGLDRPVTPKDHTRSAIADYMTGIALRFLLRHEYAHIINGHLDYIINERKLSSFDENDNDSTDAAFSQTLEMDADSFATNQAIRDAFTYTDRMIKELEIFADTRKNLFIHVFSIYALFRLFSNKLNNITNASKYSHPPAVARQMLILSNIATIFAKGKYGLSIDEVVTISSKAVVSVEDSFSAISEQDIDYETYLSAITPEALSYLRSIFVNWKNVRPRLEKYALNYLPVINK